MLVETTEELETILGLVWITEVEREELKQWVPVDTGQNDYSPGWNPRMRLPQSLPWSQTFYFCCRDVRTAAFITIPLLTKHSRSEDLFNNFMLLLRVCHNIIETLTIFFARYGHQRGHGIHLYRIVVSG
jgi:hypothetical protein